MHRSMTVFAVIALVALAGHVSLVRPAAADAVAWSVASVNGEAQVRASSGPWQPLARGQEIGTGQEIRTGDGGSVLLVRNDESVTVGAASSFEMQPAAGSMLTSIYQKLGTLMFKVHKQPDRHFEVKTPYLVAAVKGTTFTVSVDSAGGVVHVTEGLVEVGSNGTPDKVLVRPGNTASVAAARGSKVQLGVTPNKGRDASKGKQSQGPRIDRDLGAASVDIERSSNGLFKADREPASKQTATRDKSNGGDGAALGKENSLGASLETGLGLGNGNGNAGGNGNGNGNAGGNGGGQGNGNAGGNGNGQGNGKGKGKG